MFFSKNSALIVLMYDGTTIIKPLCGLASYTPTNSASVELWVFHLCLVDEAYTAPPPNIIQYDCPCLGVLQRNIYPESNNIKVFSLQY